MPGLDYFALRTVVGVIFVIDLLAYLPFANLAFGKGYRPNDRLLSKPGAWFVVSFLWMLASISLITGTVPLVGAVVIYSLFRRLFITSRWSSIFRGGGAPGFMAHWTALFLMVMELGLWLDPSHRLAGQIWNTFRIDFAVIMLCAGTYKSLSGYLSGEGMELGMVNPLWGYWHRTLRKLNPHSIGLRLQNMAGAFGEIAIGILLLVPQTRAIGAIGCTLSFLYLLPLIRLGRLAVLMAVVPLVFVPEHGGLPIVADLVPTWPLMARALEALLIGYLILLPIVKVQQYLNLFANKNFPKPFQGWLAKYANFMPIIMWRVFTADVTNFFIRSYEVSPAGERRPISWSNRVFRWLRFSHVTEAIAIVSIFTTRKYFQSRPEWFQAKLMQYASSLGDSDRYVFEYVAVRKGAKMFEYVVVAEYDVDLSQKKVTESLLDGTFDASARAAHSSIREAGAPGTYAQK